MSNSKERFRQAEQLKDAGNIAEAKVILQELLKDDPTHVMAHLTLARICTKLGEHVDAVAHAEEACKLEPNEAFNYTVLSVTCQKAWAGTQDQRYIQLAEDALARSNMLG